MYAPNRLGGQHARPPSWRELHNAAITSNLHMLGLYGARAPVSHRNDGSEGAVCWNALVHIRRTTRGLEARPLQACYGVGVHAPLGMPPSLDGTTEPRYRCMPVCAQRAQISLRHV